MENEVELYDREAEEITLGCVLLNPEENFPLLFSKLKPQDFFSEYCRHTYQAMINLRKCNTPIDQYLVARELIDMGWRKDGLCLSRMVYLTPTSYHILQYIAIVKKFSERRAKLTKAEALTREAFAEKRQIRGIEL